MTVLLIFAVLVFLLYMLYVSLIKKRNKVLEAFSGIDVQLKKRYDLIPNILTIASKFMGHEKGLLEEITKLRAEALKLSSTTDINGKISLDNDIMGKMHQFIAAVENYPDLKSDQTMLQAMRTYNEVEEHIAAARRFYNSAAQDLKNAVEIFPSSMMASLMNIKAADFIRADETERKPVNARDYLK